MSISANLELAVKSKNLPEIRNCLSACLPFDMSMTGKFHESLDYVLTHGVQEDELYENDDNALFEEEATNDNFDKIAALLSVNFSKHKLGVLRRIGQKLSLSSQSDYTNNKEQEIREPKKTAKTFDDNSSYQQGSRQSQSSRTQASTFRNDNSNDSPKDGHKHHFSSILGAFIYGVKGAKKIIRGGFSSLGYIGKIGEEFLADEDIRDSEDK